MIARARERQDTIGDGTVRDERDLTICGEGEVSSSWLISRTTAVRGDLADLVRDRWQMTAIDARTGLVEDHHAAARDADARDVEALLLPPGQGQWAPFGQVQAQAPEDPGVRGAVACEQAQSREDS